MTSHDLVPGTRQPWLRGRAGSVPLSHRLREALIVGTPAVVVTVLGWRQRWVGDDGMVYARTAREILAGQGPVFNAGERAEASSGTLWQWLLTACSDVTAKDPSVVAVTLGVLLTGIGYVLAVAAARKAVRPLSSAPLLPVGMLVLLAVKPDWDYATSGLENGLAIGWIALTWWYLVAARDMRSRRHPHPAAATRHSPYAAACLIGLGPLVQPELVLVTAVFLVALFVLLRPRPMRAAGLLATAVVLPAAYEVFRAGYYGVLVPLPTLTEETGRPMWARGLAYVTDFTEPYRLWLPVALLAVVAVQAPRRVLRPELLAPPLAGLLLWLNVSRVGGDTMHGRMLLPGLFLLMLPLCAVPLGRLTGSAAAAVAVWSVLCALLWRPPAATGAPYPILDEQRAYAASAAGPHPVTEFSHAEQVSPLLPAELAAENGRKPVLLLQIPDGGGRFVSLPLAARFRTRLAGSYGLLGYNGIVTPLDATAVDPRGVAYPLAAHRTRAATGPAGRSAQEQALDPAWIVADWTDPGVPLPAGLDPARVSAARHALSCGRLAELQSSVRAPLTPGRFWRNLTGAWSRTGFRFPADPLRAERALCRG
ncbi:hypothetical protein [Actinacidiphila acidipaludis]|uniref:Terminal beta-(1->2)-arabinofuranosyltransferase C-terminal domain-containing protein n=1 Tax=Actinacidiphila acidipaludis TaxID=2873382 RepID=A0ABS7QIP4_9ACTN|nr:hypothetical protein [Streptomyces acidipaludis]MBY8883046.1 hypothetical protein [Streptomyces acidipaludis]